MRLMNSLKFDWESVAKMDESNECNEDAEAPLSEKNVGNKEQLLYQILL